MAFTFTHDRFSTTIGTTYMTTSVLNNNKFVTLIDTGAPKDRKIKLDGSDGTFAEAGCGCGITSMRERDEIFLTVMEGPDCTLFCRTSEKGVVFYHAVLEDQEAELNRLLGQVRRTAWDGDWEAVEKELAESEIIPKEFMEGRDKVKLGVVKKKLFSKREVIVEE